MVCLQEKASHFDRASSRYQITLSKYGGSLGRLAYDDDFDLLVAFILHEGDQMQGVFLIPISKLVSMDLVAKRACVLSLYPPWSLPKRAFYKKTAQIIATSRDVTSKISEISDCSRPKLSQFSDPAFGPLLLCVLLPSQEHASWLPRRPAPGKTGLSEPDRVFFWTGSAFSSKTSLSEPDRVFFLTGKAFSGKTSLSEPERAYLSQIRCFLDTAVVSGKAFSGKTGLSEPDKVFFLTGKAFSGKTSLSEPDRVFFGLGRHFQAKRAYLNR